MADFPSQGAYVTGVNALLTERSGAAIATDTVPAGSLIIARNTGVGAHTVILACNFTVDGLAVASRTHNFAAAEIRGFRVPVNYGDANGRVAMYVGEASQTEIKYYVIGA